MNTAVVISAITLVVGGVALTVLLSAAIFREKNKKSPASKEQDQRAA